MPLVDALFDGELLELAPVLSDAVGVVDSLGDAEALGVADGGGIQRHCTRYCVPGAWSK